MEQKVDRRRRSMEETFDNHIEKVPFSGCWIWTGGVQTNGYGIIRSRGRYNRKNFLVHRFSYKRFKGPIPDGLQIDHLCSVPLCVNPDHLEAVTCKENLLRSRLPENVWHKKSSRTHCKYGHPFSGYNLLVTKSGARICRECKNANWRNQYKKSIRGPFQDRTHCLNGHEYSLENTGYQNGRRVCRQCDRDRHKKARMRSANVVPA